MQAQPYAQHKAPAIMGLTFVDMQDFGDMIIKANELQLEAMAEAIDDELKKRMI